MRQTTSYFALIALATGLGGCEKQHLTDPVSPVGGIVSLSPAATDLLLAMGLGDRIVGVSPYEANDRLRQALPKLGDYERIDWERVTAIKPGFLIVQGRRDRMPAGQREKAQLLGIKPIILQIDRLDDIRTALSQLGTAINAGANATAAVAAFDHRVDALKARTATGLSPVRTLLTFSDEAAVNTHVIGRDTFIDDALTLAGGQNVIAATGYPSIDREKLASLKPDVVFVLLPGANDAAVGRATAAVQAALPNAVIHVLTMNDVLMPGTCALNLAETMAKALKTPTTQTATDPSPVYPREKGVEGRS